MIPSDGSAPSPLIEALNAAIDRARRAYAEDLETMCEVAIQGGEHGVLVTWAGASYAIEVSPDVPYGMVHSRHV